MRKIAALSPTSWVAAKTVFSQVFAVLLFGIQAPILGPRAFGLISIVSVFVGFCEMVVGEVSSEALISLRKIDTAHFDTMNTVNVVLSGLCGVIAFGAANWVARWFGDPELASILRWMSMLPVLSALAAAPTAATKRDMQFRPLALRSMVSLFAGGMVGAVLTLTGFGVWALVWQAIVTRVTASVVLWLAVPLRLRFGFSRQRLSELMPFAAPFLVSRLMSWSTSQFPRLIYGLYWGPTELGIFGLAARLCDVLMDVTLVPPYAVARVELRQFAADREGLLTAVPRLLTRVSVVCFPLCIGCAAVAPTLFHAWLDARWYPGIVPAQLMMLMCAASVTHYCIGATLLALNYQFAEAISSTVQLVLTVLAVMIFAPLGLVAATAAYAARPLLLLPLPALLLRYKSAVPAAVVFVSQRPALIAALIMGFSVTLLRIALEPSFRAVALLPLLVAAGAVIYTAVIAILLPDYARQFLAKFTAGTLG